MKNDTALATKLFRPFRFVAGGKAFVFGIIVLLLLSGLGFYSHVFFDGVLDIHFGCKTTESPYWIHLWYQISAWIFLTVILYLAALIFSKSKIRFIDMAGTLASAKTPQILIALWGFMPFDRLCPEMIQSLDLGSLMLVMKQHFLPMMLDSLLSILIFIWVIVLMYNAFSVSANLKGTKGVLLFIAGLLIAETLSIMANSFVLNL